MSKNPRVNHRKKISGPRLVKTQFIVTLVEYLEPEADPSNSLELELELSENQPEGCTVHVKQLNQEVICE